MSAKDRINTIKQMVSNEKKVTVSNLSEVFRVTEETIRRDLEKLEIEGILTRTYGGAILNENSQMEGVPFYKRANTMLVEKRKIALKVLPLLENKTTMSGDSSSTVMELLKLLKNRKDLTILTNSTEAFNELSKADVYVVSTGGEFNKSSLSLQGRLTKEIIKKSNVEIICTTDDPADDLKYHKAIKEDKDFPVKVFPAFRPDRAINIEKEDFVTWLGLLEKAVGKKINDINGLLSALVERIEYFHEAGCRLSDHALEPVMFRHGNISEMDAVFRKALLKESFSESDLTLYKGQLMLFLGKEYAKRGWTMQIHTGTMRNNNTKMFRQLGPDTGFDAVGDYSCAKALSDLLNNLDYNDCDCFITWYFALPRTILQSLYSL